MRDVSRIPLAIVGMACRLPGADSIDEYWRLLSEGQTGYGPLPPERFDMRKHFDAEPGNRTKSYTAMGGVIQPRPFDLSRYPLPQWLIEQTAESHFNMCEVAVRAFENAGWDPLSPPNRRAGVYIGHAPPMSQLSKMIYARQVAHTAEYLREIPDFDLTVGGQSQAVIDEVVAAVRSGIEPNDPVVKLRAHAYYLPTLLSRQFSLDGPAMAFDAACASSLRALGHGARAVQLGEVDCALVGSASYCHADTLVLFSQAKSVSATGSRPFDDDADGLVASEGYVLLLIKTLEKALADGDRIQAVIRGIGISSDGKGKSLWAPRKEGQIEAVKRAYDDEVKPADLQYVEMHATSTQVGDSTEMAALVEGLAPLLPPGKRLPVGSAKANIGHALETAGLASLVKTVLAIRHETIPPQINFHTPSSKIDWANIPFYPSPEAVAWPKPASGKLRRAAVNAFGIGGLNVHVVLEEFDSRESPKLANYGKEKKAESESCPIAVVGMGAVLPGVRNIDRLWDVLAAGERQVRPVPSDRWNGSVGYAPGEDRLWTIPSNVGGFVTDFEFDWKKHKIPPKQVQTGAPLQYMLLDAADQALADAGYDKRPFDRARTGVVVGTIFGSEFGDDLQMGLRLSDFEDTLHQVLAPRGVAAGEIARMAKRYEEILLKHKPALIDETGSFTASTGASRITKTFDLMGGATAVDAGDASSFAAINAAMQMLRTGECDVMLCASGDISLSFAHFEALARRGVMTRGPAHAPFDAAADGLVPGEGACALVLKRLSDAERDGDRIHAVIRGIGSAWDSAVGAGIVRAAERALAQGSVTASQVAAVEASGLGLPETDLEEWKGVATVFGAGRAEPLPVSAATAQFGHLGGGSGIVSVMKAIAELNHAEFGSMPGLEVPAPAFAGDSRVTLASDRSAMQATDDEGRLLVGVNGISQCGLSYHMVLERPTRVAPPVRKPKSVTVNTDVPKPCDAAERWRVFRLGAASIERLADQVAALGTSDVVGLARFSAEHTTRLATVARTGDEFAARCRAEIARIRDKAQWRTLSAEGLFCGEVGAATKLSVPDEATVLAAGIEDAAVRHLLSARACLEAVGAIESSSTGAATTNVAPGLAPEYPWLNVVRVVGAPFEMGRQHGVAHANAIRLAVRRYADLAGSRWDLGPQFDAAVASPEQWFSPAQLEEIRGMAKGAGVTFESVLCHNLRLFLNGGEGGAHFAVRAERNGADGAIHAVNEDNRQAICVRDCLERSVQVRFPEDGIPHLTIGVAGQLGGMCGINARGLAVSAACLLERDASPTTGRPLPALVQSILHSATDVAAAVEAARLAKATVPYSLLLSEAGSGRIARVEWNGEILTSEAGEAAIVMTNHRRGFEATAPAHSRLRRQRLERLLGGAVPGPVALPQAQHALRDQFDAGRKRDLVWPTMNTVLRVDNQSSVVFQHATGTVWLTPGHRANGHGKHFVELPAMRLLNVAEAAAAKLETSRAAPPAPSATSQPDFKTISAREVIASYDRAAANPVEGRVCERYVLRVVEAALPATHGLPPAAPGRAVILGDNPVARAVQTQLAAQGTATVLLSSSQDPDAVLAEFEEACATDPIRHLFLCTPHDAGSKTSLSADEWKARRSQGVMLPYRICQRWFQHLVEGNLLSEASVTAVTALGGDFGISGGPMAVESGALTGLLKGVGMEVALGKGVTSGFRTKLVDAPLSARAEDLAAFVVNELAADPEGKELEVGFACGKRYLVRPVVEEVASLNLADLPRGANFVVTGGARGVTAVVARELGLRYGLKLHLVGSSPRPEVAESYHRMSADELKEIKAAVMKEALASGQKPADAWGRFEKGLEIDRSLRELRAAGVQATYYGCDVSNRDALGRVLAEIRAVDGPIVGVIHGAGFERASRFEKKQIELVDRTYAAKVDGAAVLMELTKSDPLRYFAAFGSVSGRFGGVGQTDYSSANDMLAKLIDWFRTQRPECGAAVFHWHAWDDVGMAVRPESKHIGKLHNIRFMPSMEGADHLIDELRAGLPEGEIAITELQYCREKYGSLPVDVATEPTPAPAAEPEPVHAPMSSKPVPSPRRPLIDRVVEITADAGSGGLRSLVAEMVLDPVNDLFLAQHLYKNKPMMPVVVSIEAAAEAASLLAGAGKQVVSVRDVEIVNGLRFSTESPQVARIRVTADGDRMTCLLTTDVVNRRGIVLKSDQPFLRCVVETGVRLTEFPPRRPAPPETWNEIYYKDEDIVIYHGPEFRCLKRGVEENGLVWGEYVAPPHGNLSGRRGPEGWIMPSALIDAGFYGSGVMMWVKYKGVVAIPAGIGGITLGRTPRAGEVCTSLFVDRGREGNNSLYDFTLYGDDGEVIVHVDGYKNVIVAEQPTEAMKG